MTGLCKPCEPNDKPRWLACDTDARCRLHPDHRPCSAFSRLGYGTRLMAFAEQRIWRDHQNVFLCVSSFNHAARRFYQRLGYQQVGELSDFLVSGRLTRAAG